MSGEGPLLPGRSRQVTHVLILLIAAFAGFLAFKADHGPADLDVYRRTGRIAIQWIWWFPHADDKEYDQSVVVKIIADSYVVLALLTLAFFGVLALTGSSRRTRLWL